MRIGMEPPAGEELLVTRCISTLRQKYFLGLISRKALRSLILSILLICQLKAKCKVNKNSNINSSRRSKLQRKPIEYTSMRTKLDQGTSKLKELNGASSDRLGDRTYDHR